VHAALQELSASVEGRLSKRCAPAPGKGFKRVAGVLQDGEWLAKDWSRASSHLAVRHRQAVTAPFNRMALSAGVPAPRQRLRTRRGADGATAGSW